MAEHPSSRDNGSPVWLGIDLGTQSVRVVAVSSDGQVLGAGAAGLASHRDGVRHEQQPEDWWTATAQASRSALADVPVERIQGLAVDATSGTVLLVDSAGRALSPGLMYDDTRAVAEAEQVNGAGGAVWAALGYHRMQAAWGLPKLLWLCRGATQVSPGARLAHQSDFINQRLAERPVAADLSNALKTGCHLLEERWPHEVFEALRIPPEILPPLVRSGARLGEVCPAAAAETGIPAGTPIFAGMTDGCSAQLGSGALSEGSWNSVLGTTLVLKGVSRELLKDPGGVLYSHRSPDGHWLPGGAANAGAAVLSRDFGGRDLEALTAQAATRLPTPVAAYPLAHRGERFPFAAPQAEGFLLGSPADEAEHFGAVLQGAAFVERLCFAYLDLLGAPTGGDLSLTGGAARNKVWTQLRANVLGRTVILPANAEPALGMAVLAAAARSNRPLTAAAGEMVRIRERIDPQPGRTAPYLEIYVRLLHELERRGWLPPVLAQSAITSATS